MTASCSGMPSSASAIDTPSIASATESRPTENAMSASPSRSCARRDSVRARLSAVGTSSSQCVLMPLSTSIIAHCRTVRGPSIVTAS